MRLITAISSLAPLLSVCLVGLAYLPQASAECCEGHSETPYDPPICGDCSVGTPYCAYGPCNIFGCNCDGGCRHGACDSKLGKVDAEKEPDTSEKDIPEEVNDAAQTLKDAACHEDMENIECIESMTDMLKEAQIW